MSNYLEQNDIDEILGNSTPNDELEQDTSGVREFDFSTQQKIIRGKIPALDVVNDAFARFYQRSLSLYLGTAVSVAPSDVKQMRMSEYQDILKQPTSLNVVKITPFTSGPMIVVLESKLCFSILNVFHGGSSDFHYRIEGRDFHPIEKEYIRGLFDAVSNDYIKAWQPIADIDLELVHTATNPKMDTSTSPNEAVYVSQMDISFEGGSGAIHFCIPLRILSPFVDELEEKVKAFQGGIGSNWKSTIAGELVDSKVTACLTVGEASVPLSEFTSMEIGDTFPITKFNKAVLSVDGHPLAIGMMGASESNNKSIRIEGAVKHPGKR